MYACLYGWMLKFMCIYLCLCVCVFTVYINVCTVCVHSNTYICVLVQHVCAYVNLSVYGAHCTVSSVPDRSLSVCLCVCVFVCVCVCVCVCECVSIVHV